MVTETKAFQFQQPFTTKIEEKNRN